jgi:hypothetical protein
MIRTVHQQYIKLYKMFTKIMYVSLQSQRRELHEKQSYNAQVTSYLRFQKLVVKLDLIKKFESS